jgi:hypothetical protein
VIILMRALPAIKSFVFESLSPPVTGVVDPAAETVTVTVPIGTDVTNIAPTIGLTPDAEVIPNTVDFSNPVTYTVTAGDGSFAVWTVTVEYGPITSLDNIVPYLNSATAAGDIADPVPLPVGIALSSAAWRGLLDKIEAGGKYVNLDLSACPGFTDVSGGGLYADGTFDPFEADTDTGRIAAKGKIVSLVLPGDAASIVDGREIEKENESNEIYASFQHFAALKSVTGEGITSIGELAFALCDALESVDFPGAAGVGYGAFFGCMALESARIPSVTSIGLGAFGYTALEEIQLPASLTEMGANPFLGCADLTIITIDDGNPSYKAEDGKIFSKDGKTLIRWPIAATEGVISLSDIETVGDYAFLECENLTEVYLPDAVIIKEEAFANCGALTTVTLSKAETIGDEAFHGCGALTTAILPNAESIGRKAFRKTGGGMPLVVTLGAAAPRLGTDLFSEVSKTVTVKVPVGAAGYAESLPADYSGAENTSGGPYWGEGFRGRGWDGAAYLGDTANSNVSLTIEDYTP